MTKTRAELLRGVAIGVGTMFVACLIALAVERPYPLTGGGALVAVFAVFCVVTRRWRLAAGAVIGAVLACALMAAALIFLLSLPGSHLYV
jgi:hypothetical protein